MGLTGEPSHRRTPQQPEKGCRSLPRASTTRACPRAPVQGLPHDPTYQMQMNQQGQPGQEAPDSGLQPSPNWILHYINLPAFLGLSFPISRMMGLDSITALIRRGSGEGKTAGSALALSVPKSSQPSLTCCLPEGLQAKQSMRPCGFQLLSLWEK